MFQIISEAAFAPSYGKVEILEESLVPGGTSKLIFRAILQEAEVVNNNKRVYPAETLMAVVQQLRVKAQERKLLGELDHPQPQGDNKAKLKRSSTILLGNVCVLFRKLDFIDGKIIAECETLSNAAGMDLYNLLKDNAVIGFSLRAFGETRERGSGIVEVLANGLKALTFDVVANPSHDTAVITEFLTEGSGMTEKELMSELVEEMSSFKLGMSREKSSMVLEEAQALFKDIKPKIKENDQICINGICMRGPIEETVDYLIAKSFKKPKMLKIV